MAAQTSFPDSGKKLLSPNRLHKKLFIYPICYHLVNDHKASALRLCSSVRQFLIYSTFVLVRLITTPLAAAQVRACPFHRRKKTGQNDVSEMGLATTTTSGAWVEAGAPAAKYTVVDWIKSVSGKLRCDRSPANKPKIASPLCCCC